MAHCSQRATLWMLAAGLGAMTTASPGFAQDESCPRIDSVRPSYGEQGSIVTITGSGFRTEPEENCVVMGGMGAYGYVLPGATPTKLQLRVGPVPKEKVGDILLWVGRTTEYPEDHVQVDDTVVRLRETEIFQNRPDCPVATADVEFALTRASSNTYEGTYEKVPRAACDLKGLEKGGGVLRASFPRSLVCENGSRANILVILKEPTLGVELETVVESRGNALSGAECLNAIAEAITRVSSSSGQQVQACVVDNKQYGEIDLLVTKRDLSAATAVIAFDPRATE